MNLHSKHLKTLQILFAKHPSIKEALLFGSRALGTHKESSDIDIALKGDITPTLLAHLKEELEDSTLPYFCDILDYERAPQELREHIDTHALTLYKREEEWQEVRLGDVVEIKYGKDHKHLESGDIPTYGSGGIMRYVDSAIYDKESVLIPRKGTLNNIFYTKNPFWVVDTMFYTVIDTQKILPKFLYYTLKTFDFNLYNVGSAVPSLTTKILNDIQIPLPPLERQKEIAEILSSFDDKIDFLHRQNRTLESLAQTLFRHYFIENAKEEWGEGSLFEWVEDTLGGDWGKEFPNKDFNKQVVCFRGTDIADLNNGLPTKIPLRYIKESKLKKIEPKNGDIIFEISGGTETQSTGRATYINENVKALFNSPIVFSNFCRLLVIKNENYSFFLYLYLRYLYENNEFFAYENGSSGIKNLDYKGLLSDNLVKIPPQKEIINFNNEVKEYFYKIDKNKKEIQRLKFLVDQSLFLLDLENK